MNNYFKSINTLDELKKEYKRLAMQHHPDRGGNLQVMQAINAEYDKMFNVLKDKHNNNTENKYKVTETPEAFREILSRIINLAGLDIEICGNWLWLSGNTYNYKDLLKELGFKWANKKFMWYWRAEEYKSFSRKSYSMNAIREKYGSEKIVGSTSYQIA